MDTSTPTINRVLYGVCGVAFAAPAIFFTYYTVRLIYVNLGATAEEAATHRSMGILIGAIAFPVVTIVLGLISRFFINKAWRGFSGNG